MSRTRKVPAWFALIGTITSLICAPVNAVDPPTRFFRIWPRSQDDVGHKPATGAETCMEELGRNIDWLEHQINVNGTVVAKTPDVWGEARMTAHRQEFEKELKKELAAFDKKQINAAEIVSDQAFLAFALAVKAGEGATPPNINLAATATQVGTDNGNPVINTQFTPPTAIFGQSGSSLTVTNALSGIQLEQTEVLDQLSRYINHLHEHRRINEGDDTSDAPGYAMNLVRIPVSLIPGSGTKHGYGAEITVTAQPYLGPELLPTAFRDLVINDLVDQLSVPMTRLVNNDPKAMRELAKIFENLEVTRQNIAVINAAIDAGQNLFGDNLELQQKLQSHFVLNARTLWFYAVNGSAIGTHVELEKNIRAYIEEFDALMKAVGLTSDQKIRDAALGDIAAASLRLRDALFNSSNVKKEIDKANAAIGKNLFGENEEKMQRAAEKLEPIKDTLKFFTAVGFRNYTKVNPENALNYVSEFKRVIDAGETQTVAAKAVKEKTNIKGKTRLDGNDITSILNSQVGILPDTFRGMLRQDLEKPKNEWTEQLVVATVENIAGKLDDEAMAVARKEFGDPSEEPFGNPAALLDFQQRIPTISLPASTVRKATLPFPPSHLIDNYGLHELGHIVMEAYNAFQNDILNRQVVHVTDVQALLREELGAAYELMRSDAMHPWWEKAAAEPRRLYEAIRLRQQPEIDRLREEFLNGIGPFTRHHRSTASLAWCIYVESLLLNERLIDDMRETFGNKPGSPIVCHWLPYFGPNPPPEARDAFAQYVKVRWPIHVFQIDPVVTEQNIADIRSVYRQMQMAVALAFSQKSIGVSAAMQAMRKLQRDRATFDLNRTVVGFGHGDDTFGWRFYPRFQTQPVESNTTVFFRDLIIGGPTDKQLECSKEIEPGIRECIAVVLMPSFVPHVTFQTRGNWFKLNCASRTASSVHDTLQYSRVVKQMEMNAMQCGQCAHLYRDGEIDRLMQRVHQLDRKLALQTLECQIPIENTHGGFEIFSSGTRELAPELVGWYGAPGYDPARSTRLFLSGDNFNVTTCKLIAGNQQIEFELLSRQILVATLPAGLPVIRDEKLDEGKIDQYGGYIDAHLATPYGVSGHLLIPVVRTDTAAAPQTGWVPAEIAAVINRKVTKGTPPAPDTIEYDMSHLLIGAPGNLQLRFPGAGVPPATTKIHFSIVEAESNALRGSFTVDQVPADPKTGGFQLNGKVLSDFALALKGTTGLSATTLKAILGDDKKQFDLLLQARLQVGDVVTDVIAPPLKLRLQVP